MIPAYSRERYTNTENTEATLSVEVKIDSKKKFEIISEGNQPAVLADIANLGLVETDFGKKPQVRLVFILEELDTEGRQKRAFITANVSFNEKAKLRKFVLQLLRAKGETLDPEAKSVKLEPFVGDQVQLVIGHEDGKEEPYAKILSIMKPAKGQDVQIPEDFKRKEEKDKTA